MGLTKSPAGAHQWTPKKWRGQRHGTGRARALEAPFAIDADHGPRLRLDRYEKFAAFLRGNPDQFANAFARRGSS